MTTNNFVQIFDTTLRDGEQSPGATMNVEDKLIIARQLEKLQVDVIEAGFAAASDGDADAVRAVADVVSSPIVLSLARTRQGDIEAALRSVERAKRPGIHIFIATSELHLKRKLMMSHQEVVDAACYAVNFAKQHVAYIEFSAEDASRSDPDYLVQVFGEVIKAGACTLNVPDTTGYAVPQEFGALFRDLIERTPGGDRVIWSAHCHNDLGMAVANSLAGVQAGIRQIECTINGIGERAGNCSLEEVVMALKTRAAFFNLATNINTQRLYPTSRLLSSITGMPIARNKAVVGENAFAHESGIHQHGMLKHHSTYEIMRPEDVGLQRSHLVLGKHSGRHAFRDRVQALGFELDEADLNRAFEEFKALADKKKELFDGDIEAIVLSAEGSASGPWHLKALSVEARSNAAARATVVLAHSDGRSAEHTATGDGPVDAAFKAIEAASGIRVQLRKFEVHSVSEGEDAQGEARIYVQYNQRTYRGASVSTNIVESATRAFLEVINRIELAQSGARSREERSAATPA
jgi:2-isopropylmalate synthase